MFYPNLTGELRLLDGILTFFVPAFLGNVFGGTVVFSLITWGQVRQEVMNACKAATR
ncbi:hypothetical protein SAMN04488003_10910 [Loktanella fryxellensis]|uniref:Formate/nitrite transporter n=1 Tax=Loktanella fryxellensis TaxID=245187 RepID=A0A1H8DP33_9RHOB|nr:hypothetical protein [Loktanella fryxellensis]SEN08990.1 hypothetical protein SAMN04488003_10910 [Loktanella fryxellensis]